MPVVFPSFSITLLRDTDIITPSESLCCTVSCFWISLHGFLCRWYDIQLGIDIPTIFDVPRQCEEL